MDGSQFNATWRKVSDEYMVQLEPVRAGGRLPPRGALLDVTVRRKDGTSKPMAVRVVAEARDGSGRARVALAEPAVRSGGPTPGLRQQQPTGARPNRAGQRPAQNRNRGRRRNRRKLWNLSRGRIR